MGGSTSFSHLITLLTSIESNSRCTAAFSASFLHSFTHHYILESVSSDVPYECSALGGAIEQILWAVLSAGNVVVGLYNKHCLTCLTPVVQVEANQSTNNQISNAESQTE